MILYFLALGIGAIVITGVFSFRAARRALLERSYDQLTSIRLTRKTAVERFLNDRLKEAGYIAKSGDTNLISVSGYYTGFCVFKDLNKKETSGAYIADYATIKNYTGNLIAVAPANEAGNHLGLVIKAGLIDSIMLEVNPEHGLGYSGETYLTGSDHLMRTRSRFIEGSVMKTSVITLPVIKAFEGTEGTILAKDYRGIKVLSSFGRINVQGLDWAILAELDYSEATSSISTIRNNIIIISLITAIALFALTYTISRAITRPLVSLKKAASELGDGKSHDPLPVESDDEIGELTEAFNSMTDNLKLKDEALRIERINSVKSAIDGQDRERQRLSRELHDGIGQGIIGVRLRLAVLENRVPEEIKEDVSSIIRINDMLIDEVRATSNALMPPALAEFGLITAVKSIGNNIYDSSGIKVEIDGELPDGLFGRKPVLYIFRMIQEALNNAAKHSDASLIRVSIRIDREKLKLNISDNGKGFDPDTTTKGSGLSNLKERVSLLKGSVTILSSPGNGTSIIACIPVNKSQYDKIVPC